MICLDKNHPPQGLQSAVENINKLLNKHTTRTDYTLVKVAMVPGMAPGGRNLYQDYPFS